MRLHVLGGILGSLSIIVALGASATPPAENGKTVYTQLNLVSDESDVADHQDPNLVNAWGLAFGPTASVVWIADNETHKSTLYDGAGNPQPLVVTIPGPNNMGTGSPTGIVFNGSDGFR